MIDPDAHPDHVAAPDAPAAAEARAAAELVELHVLRHGLYRIALARLRAEDFAGHARTIRARHAFDVRIEAIAARVFDARAAARDPAPETPADQLEEI